MAKTKASTKVATQEDRPRLKKRKAEPAAKALHDSAITVALTEALVDKQLRKAEEVSNADADEYEDEGTEVVLPIKPRVTGREIPVEVVGTTPSFTSQVIPDEDDVDEVPIEIDDSAKNLLIMDKPWCFKCTHLVSTDQKRSEQLKAYKECHYMSGNKNCPARTTRLVRGLPIEETALALFEATRRGDLEQDLKIRRKLATFDETMQGLVNRRFLELIRSSN